MALYDIVRTVNRCCHRLALAVPCLVVFLVECSNFASARQMGHPMLASGGTAAAIVVILLRSICYGLPLPMLFCIPERGLRLPKCELQTSDIALIALGLFVLPWWLLLAGVQQRLLITFAAWAYGYALGIVGFIIVAALNLIVWISMLESPQRFRPTRRLFNVALPAGHLILASVLLVCAPYYADQ